MSGLSSPLEAASSKSGDLYFTQFPSSDTVTISQLKHGSATPSEVYSLTGMQPTVLDIQVERNGDLLFVAAVGLVPDESVRQWSLVQLDPSTGVASTLVSTTGNDVSGPGWDPGPGGGTSINLNGGADDSGTVYFTEDTIDPVSGNESSDLLALDPGSSTPRDLAHFAVPGGAVIIDLAVAKDGNVYVNGPAPDGNGQEIYQWSTCAGLRTLVPEPTVPHDSNGHVGLDAAGNLYVLTYQFNGFVHGLCAASTTMSVFRFKANQLNDTNPTPTAIAQTTYPGWQSPDFGSPSFFRVSDPGDVYQYQVAAN